MSFVASPAHVAFRREARELLEHGDWRQEDAGEHGHDRVAADLLYVLVIRLLEKMPYADYLRTVHWQHVRELALAAAGYRCQMCNSPGPILDVHHRTYERRGYEQPGDVTVLCRKCHGLFHGKKE